MVGHGGSNAGSYLADPTSPIPSHCASIVATSTLRVKLVLFMARSHWAFLSVADAFPMEIDKHQAMFRRYNRTFCE